AVRVPAGTIGPQSFGHFVGAQDAIAVAVELLENPPRLLGLNGARYGAVWQALGLLEHSENALLLLGRRLAVGGAQFAREDLFLPRRQVVQPAKFLEDLFLALRRRLLVLSPQFLEDVFVYLERGLVRFLDLFEDLFLLVRRARSALYDLEFVRHARL